MCNIVTALALGALWLCPQPVSILGSISGHRAWGLKQPSWCVHPVLHNKALHTNNRVAVETTYNTHITHYIYFSYCKLQYKLYI